MTWTPKRREGFFYSSDARFSRHRRVRLDAACWRRRTRPTPRAPRSSMLNPAIEPTAQPRSYVIEATVTGADDQTVTAHRSRCSPCRRSSSALKVPRYPGARGRRSRPEILVVGLDGKPVAGKEVTVQLLQARSGTRSSGPATSATGSARYVTDVGRREGVRGEGDERRRAAQRAAPLARLRGLHRRGRGARPPRPRPGAWRVDLFAGGDQPVTWSKPPAGRSSR